MFSIIAIAELLLLLLYIQSAACGLCGNDSRPIYPINSRSKFGWMLQNHEPTFKMGAEIGVQRGLFAHDVLKSWPNCQTYFLVDPWMSLDNYQDVANVQNSTHNHYYNETLRRLEPWKNKTRVLRMFSSEAAHRFQLEATDPQTGVLTPPLDFVYIDARHDYCSAAEDIQLWWPLVKPGGILSGHDFLSEYPRGWDVCPDGSYHPGSVQKAVLDFATSLGLQVVTTSRDYWETWMIRKPAAASPAANPAAVDSANNNLLIH